MIQISQIGAWWLSLYTIADYIEIIFFIGIFTTVGWWIKKDKSPLLSSFFFGYALSLTLATYFELHAILTFLYFYTPSACLLLLMMHQEQLQKKLITLKRISLVEETADDWIETIIFGALHARSISKKFICCIEQQDILDTLIQCPLKLDVALNKQMAQLILESRFFQDNLFVWINQQGIVRGINCSLIHSSIDLHLIPKKTDAVIIESSPEYPGFKVYIDTVYHEQITAKQLSLLLKQQCINYQKKQSQGSKYVKTSASKDREQSYS